mmetsp:Transcript_25214/g.64032  ORF Transcript_25214/g.64032 Transcript_25214/m.64032 type:complete len:276 (+) Transcript_25214:1140-1967(+)
MTSAVLLVVYPEPSVPTTMHTPSGLRPHLAWRTMGLACPMQSTSSLPLMVDPYTRWVAVGSERNDRTTASGCTVTPARSTRSYTRPPAASSLARMRVMSASGLTPQLSTSRVHTSPAPWNPTRTGLNSMAITPSSSSRVSRPSSTSSIISLRLMFHSCARPRSAPRSTTATRQPRVARDAATKTPSVPPATITSYTGCSLALCPPAGPLAPAWLPRGERARAGGAAGKAGDGSCLTNWGAGPAAAPSFIVRILDQFSSTRWNASHVVAPPAPLAC